MSRIARDHRLAALALGRDHRLAQVDAGRDGADGAILAQELDGERPARGEQRAARLGGGVVEDARDDADRPARDDLDVAEMILNAAHGRLHDVDVGAAGEPHAAHRDGRMTAPVGVAVDDGEMRIERVGEPRARHEGARMRRHGADDRAVSIPVLAGELERTQTVARPHELLLGSGRADPGHDHDLVVVLELIEPDEYGFADLEDRARRLEPSLESAAAGSEDETAHAGGARVFECQLSHSAA